jgi:hypothetical protein
MPYAFVPPGYNPVLLGQAQSVEELGTFAPLEEGAAEGARVLLRLDFTEQASGGALGNLEQACRDAGVELWPGSEYYVYADTASTTVYLVWQKGLAWLPIIIGIVATIALPPLITAGVWLILPSSLKSLISNIVNIGILLLVMLIVMKMMPALSPAKQKPKQVKEAAG